MESSAPSGDWDRLAVLTHPSQVSRHGALDPPRDLAEGLPGRYAARKVRDVGAEPGCGGLDHHPIAEPSLGVSRFHFLPSLGNPDCVRMLASVPAAISSPGAPNIVTRPGLVGWVN